MIVCTSSIILITKKKKINKTSFLEEQITSNMSEFVYQSCLFNILFIYSRIKKGIVNIFIKNLVNMNKLIMWSYQINVFNHIFHALKEL